MKHIFFILTMCFTTKKLYSQKYPEEINSKIDSLKKLGRDALVKMASEKKANDGFDANGYDRIEVKAYKDKLVVEYKLSVKLVDGSCYYDQVWVALVGSGGGASIEGDCDDPKYHAFTDKEKKKVQFVFDSIDKSDEIGHLKGQKIPAGTHMTITEKVTYYYVEMSDWSTYSHYEVNKFNGKISNAAYKHYARSEELKDDFEIIN